MIEIIKRKLKRIAGIRYREHRAFPWFFSKKKAVYVIRFFYGEGLLSMLNSACGQAYHARKCGYIPYVDLQHFRTQYYVGKRCNSWEYFFSQPKEYSANTKLCSYSRILSCYSPPDYEDGNLFIGYDFKDFSAKKQIFDSFFEINSSIIETVNKLADDLQIDECIGVFARGTDYVALKPKSHNIQPTIEELICVCEQFLIKYDKRIFAVTEDVGIFNALKDRFGDRIISVPNDIRFDTANEKKPLYKSVKNINKIEVAKTYLIKILLLSRCQYLVAGKTHGSLWACIFNDEKYEDIYLFDKGKY